MSKNAPRELNAAGLRAGKIVQAEAKHLAPKGTHEGGGAVVPIEQSIHLTQSTKKNTVTIIAGGKSTPHAAPLEFGGSIPRRGFKGINRRGKRTARLLGGGGVLTHVKAHPYIFPAIRNKAEAVMAEYVKALEALASKFGR